MNAWLIRSKSTLTTEELAEIGSIALESTACETTVEVLIWGLSGLAPNVGKHFTHGLQLNSRLELLSALGKSKLDIKADVEKFTSIVSELKDLNNKRNLAIHGSWSKFVTFTWGDNPTYVNGTPQPKSWEEEVKALKRRLNTPDLEMPARCGVARGYCDSSERWG